MLLDTYDLEFLKLCAAARYLPCRLTKKYGLPMLSESRARILTEAKYIKQVRAEMNCYRLHTRGRNILGILGYSFADDTRTHKRGRIFRRRAINADINAMLYGAGINIFAGTVQELDGMDNSYVSSLAIRSDTRSKILAGTKFYGILRVEDRAYVIYHADIHNDGVYPDYERQTFINLLRGITEVRNVSIILVGETVEELMRIIFPIERPVLQRGLVSYSEIMEKWSYDTFLIPLNTDGISQIKQLGKKYIRECIARDFSDTELRPGLSFCDGADNEMSYIVGLDMNISRVARALEQSLRADIIPNIICMPYQCEMYKVLADRNKYPKQIKFKLISADKLTQRFPELTRQFQPEAPVLCEDGGYVTL